MTDKKLARQSVQAIRRSMPLEDNAVLSGIINDKVLSLQEYTENNNIYAYMSFGNEVDVRPIMEAGALSRKNIAVPRVDGDSMFFHLLNNNSGLFSG
ncbi:MAG: 5-formyltetrahydrofolate cyclo-ligase, partial [Butyrivibrio sp.]